MEPVLMFRSGRWISYQPNENVRISNEMHLRAAAVYATAVSQGETENDALIIAETLIFKELYEGIKFIPALENKLKNLVGRA